MPRVTRPGARTENVDHLTAIRALAPLLVTIHGEDPLEPSLRGVRSAVTSHATVLAARVWAHGDSARGASVTTAVAALSSRSYRASSEALQAASIPF